MDKSDIVLINKLKVVDVPSLNSAVGNIQKALQKYVNFSGIDYEYCDTISDLMDRAQSWSLQVESAYNEAEVHSINTSKGDDTEVGVFSDNAEITILEFLETAELAYLGKGNSMQKANRLFNKHLSEEIKSKVIKISDNYAEMKAWLIRTYGGPSRIVNDIVSNLALKPKPSSSSKKEKYTFYSAITGAIQHLERLSRVNYIDKVELETCLLSRSILSYLTRLLPTIEHDVWVPKMTKLGLDFKNPVGLSAFDCFKSVGIMERNTAEIGRASEPNPTQNSSKNKTKSSFSTHQVDNNSSGDKQNLITAHSTSSTPIQAKPKQWIYPQGLKFLCPIANHKHEMTACAEYFAYSLLERWAKINRARICYCCLKPKSLCQPRRC